MDQADIGASNKADVKILDRADTRDNNGVGMTIGSHSEDKVVSRVENKVDNRDFYRLDSFILKNNYAENFFSHNFTDVLANFFGDLSPTSINFCSSLVFPISSSHPVIFNDINGCKPLDSTSSNSLTTCNPSNILAFYY